MTENPTIRQNCFPDFGRSCKKRINQRANENSTNTSENIV